MRRPPVEEIFSDVVVVGSGVAGLTAALGAWPLSAIILTKSRLGQGGSSCRAQGGIAAALGEDDSPRLHADDTLAVGMGLSNPEVVELLTAEGPLQVQKLIELGAAFDQKDNGKLLLGREAAHSRRRIIHAQGDSTGAEMVRTLVDAVNRNTGLRIVEKVFASDLLVEEGRVVGVLTRSEEGRWVIHRAEAVVLATGGVGQLFSRTTNPSECTADGLAMAARAGARLTDLEFVQFHPTALSVEADPMPLLTEALRGEGAILIDGQGRRFMFDVHPQGELAPRDTMARAIWRRLARGETVFLDAREAVGPAFPERFPTVFGHCRTYGIDPRRQPIPASPAAHYHIGGISVDCSGRSSLPGLWACGEAAATGAHGANRLASNSLLEALVFGARVAKDMRHDRNPSRPASSSHPILLVERPEPDERIRACIRSLMWEKVGLVREKGGLQQTLKELTALENRFQHTVGEVRNMLTVGRLITTAALARKESRGVHYRSDHRKSDRRWNRHIFLTEPVSETSAMTCPTP